MATLVTTAKKLDSWLESFVEFEKRAAGHELPWLRQLRQDAFARFAEVGFPSTHDEDWRFTNISAISQTPFRLASESTVSAAQLEQWQLASAACRLVFINGRFAPGLSVAGEFPSGVVAGSLAEHIRFNPAAVEPHLGRYLNTQRDAFAALNTAFTEDGAYISIPRGAVLEQPLHILFVSAGESEPAATHPRNLIVAGENSQATIVEEYVSLNGAGSRAAEFCNTVTELVAGDQSNISHYMLEREHRAACNVSTLRIQQGRHANVDSHSLLLGGALVRNNVHPVLNGEGAECLINGLFIGSGTQHMDNYMLVEHARPHCDSRQFYNGVLDGHAHGVFHGRIIVHKDAQKTDAKQTNRNLLLSDDAQVDTKPQLEIYADDVKCTHGATIGQIAEEALFYLRSRGLDEVAARKLLLLAFARECLDRMKEGATRDHVEALVNEALLQAATATQSASSSKNNHSGCNWQEIG
jgi:Fe-S cluster assembly protein SufD